jgi:trigger factor
VKIEIKDISESVKELTINIDAAEALKEYNKILMKFKNYVIIPGFRKGKAPVAMIERNYGEHAKEEFFNQKLGDYYKAAIDEKELKPVNQGEATKVEWEKGKDLKATFKYEVMPEITVEKYKGLKIPYEETKFKKDMVDATIEDFRLKMANEITSETSEEGDIIKATIKFLDDNDEVTKEIEREFTLGANSYSKSFNEKLTSVKVEDEVRTKLFTKSQDSSDNEINSDLKDRDFLVKVISIKRKELPELNDDFAKDLEYDSLNDLREKVSEELKIRLKKENAERKHNAIITGLIEENPFEIPPSMIKKYAENMAKPYVDAYKMELEKILPMYMGMAEFNLKSHFILDELKKIEKVEITAEDKEEIIKESADNLKMELDKYKEMYKKQIESDDFKYAAEEKKLLDLLEMNSKFVPYPKEKAVEKTKVSENEKEK